MSTPEIKDKKHRTCRRCRGLAPYDAIEGVYKCTSCGHEEMDRFRQHQFLESHKMEILRCVQTKGATEARRQFGILRSTFGHVAARWGLHQVWEVPGMSSRSTDGLPKLPSWRKDWTPEFKMKWLETYCAIVKSQEAKE